MPAYTVRLREDAHVVMWFDLLVTAENPEEAMEQAKALSRTTQPARWEYLEEPEYTFPLVEALTSPPDTQTT